MEERVTVEIDGKQAKVPKGLTILEAASQVGIDIPHLCYFPGLPASGACRLCVVEVDGQEELAPACAQRVREGMVVRTRVPRVLEARRFVLELLWSFHYGDCATCEKSGACALQKYTYELEVDKTRFPLHGPEKPGRDTASLFIHRDLQLCVLCGRCIRACQELGQGILEFARRGVAMEVTTPFGRPLQESGCDFCGSCVAACPVGALVEKNRHRQGREWDFRSSPTICHFCNLGCEVLLDTVGGKIVRARPGRDGYLCARGKFGWDFLSHGDRLRSPLIRDGQGFREASWEEALDLICARLLSLRNTYGPQAIAGVIGGWLPAETYWLFGKWLQDGLRTRQFFTPAGPWARALSALHSAFGGFHALAGVADVEEAEAVLAMGAGLGEQFPRLRVALHRAKRQGTKLIVMDPLDSELSRLADVVLRPRPGEEGALLEALIRAVSSLALEQKPFPSQVRDYLAAWRALPDHAAQAGVSSAGQVEEAAKELAQRKWIAVVGEVGENTWLRTLILLLLTGRTERALLPLSPHAQFLTTALLPFPPVPAGKPNSAIAGLYVLGTDPAGWLPDWSSLLTSLEFLVVHDLFLTKTAEHAQVVLPLPGPFEEEGTFITGAGEVRRFAPVHPAPLPASSRVLAELLGRMGVPSQPGQLEEALAALRQGHPAEPRLPSVSPPPSLSEELPLWGILHLQKFELPEVPWTKHAALAELLPQSGEWVAMGPGEAEALGIEESELVLVRGPGGESAAIAKFREGLPAGLVLVSLPVWSRLGGGDHGAVPLAVYPFRR